MKRIIKKRKESPPNIPVVVNPFKNSELLLENLTYHRRLLLKSTLLYFEKSNIKVPGPLPRTGFSFNASWAIFMLDLWLRDNSGDTLTMPKI